MDYSENISDSQGREKSIEDHCELAYNITTPESPFTGKLHGLPQERNAEEMSRLAAEQPATASRRQQLFAAASNQNNLSGTDEVDAIVYYNSKSDLTLQQVVNVLQDPNMSLVSKNPPCKPTGGSVFVFPSSLSKTTRRCDRYNWITDGTKTLPRRFPLVRKHYFYARTTTGSKTKEFRKSEYELIKQLSEENSKKYVLVEYIGDESVAGSGVPHGNRRNSETPYIRSTAEVKKAIQSRAPDTSPQRIYRDLVTSIPCSGPNEAVLKPRNKEQVRNFQKAVKRQQRISHDGLYNCLELAYQFPDYIAHIQIYPYLVIRAGCHELIAEMDNVSRLLRSDSGGPKLKLQYDTTFTLGDFYVSVLSFRHEVFDQRPAIPVAFLIHERKYKIDHEGFMESLKIRCKTALAGQFVLTTDSEFDFSGVFPDAVMLHCWNHLRRNVRHWLRTHGASSADEVVYSGDIRKLLECESEKEFDQELTGCSATWSQEFKEHFERAIESNIRKFAGRWILEQVGCFNAYSGTTTNAAESLNKVLHELSKWKERPMDALLVSLRYYQLFCWREIQRGIHRLGNFSVCSRYSCILQPPELLPTSDAPKSPEEIVSFVKTGFSQLSTNTTDTSEGGHSTKQDVKPGVANQALAKDLVETNKVVFVPELKSFMVEGSKENKYAVTLFPTEKCQCVSTSTCYHILAAKLHMGMPLESKRQTLNLTQLRKRSLGGRGKRPGRKRPKPGDYEVEPAPDSLIKIAAREKFDGSNEVKKLDSLIADSLQDIDSGIKNFINTAHPSAVEKLKTPALIQVENRSDVVHLSKNEACVANVGGIMMVIVKKTVVPAVPILVAYTRNRDALDDASAIATVALFAKRNMYAKSVKIIAKLVAAKASIEQILSYVMEGRTNLKPVRCQTFELGLICSCRQPEVFDDENNVQLIKCSTPVTGSQALCYRKYHKECVGYNLIGSGDGNAQSLWLCPFCVLPELPRWGSTGSIKASNTCSFDNFLALTCLHLISSPHVKQRLEGYNDGSDALLVAVNELANNNPATAKEVWMKFLLAHSPVNQTTDGKWNFHGTESQRFLSFIDTSFMVTEQSECQSDSCPIRVATVQRNMFSANADTDVQKFAASFEGTFEVNCGRRFDFTPSQDVSFCIDTTTDPETNKDLSTYYCSRQRRIGPAAFVNPDRVWIIPFHVGGLCSVDQALQFPDAITIGDLVFNLSFITLHSAQVDHFLALVRWKKCWFRYDGLCRDTMLWRDDSAPGYGTYVPNYVVYLLA